VCVVSALRAKYDNQHFTGHHFKKVYKCVFIHMFCMIGRFKEVGIWLGNKKYNYKIRVSLCNVLTNIAYSETNVCVTVHG